MSSCQKSTSPRTTWRQKTSRRFGVRENFGRKTKSQIFLVNGVRVNVPSYGVKTNDVVIARPISFKNKYFQALVESVKKHKVPSWINFNTQTLEAKISGLPTSEEVSLPYNLQLITEYYSK